MRKWMNLFEDTALFSEVEAASMFHMGIPLYGEEAKSWYGTDNPEELVQIISNDLDKAFASGLCSLCRIINVPDSVIAKLQPGMTLGPKDQSKPASWTTDWQDIEPSALHINSIHDDLDNLFVIEADIPYSAVDIALTIAQNIHLHWEKEITLLRGHDIRLVSIHRAESYGVLKEAMRPDLWGKVFKS